MEAITSNYHLGLASTNVNPATLDKFTFKTLNRIQQTSAPFLLFLLKIAARAGDRHIIWGKTPADLERNGRSSFKSLFEYDSGVDSENKIDTMPLKDNMPQIVDVFRSGQGIATWNKNLIFIMTVCLLSYFYSERTNIFQMMNGHFLFANYVAKRAIESLHQLGIVVSNETIWRALQVNAWAILTILEEWVKSQQFFIFYNNINFYENVRNQRLYNKVHMVNYTARYICFINAPDGSSFPHISSDNIDYNAVNSLTAKNFLLDKVEYNHRFAAMHYILGRTLGKHFGAGLKA